MPVASAVQGSIALPVVDHADRAGDDRARGSQGDIERGRVAAAGMVGVTGEGVGRGGRADVRVERVDRGRAQAEPAGAGDRDGARRLGGAVVDDADRAGDDRARGSQGDIERGRVAAAGMVGVTGEGVGRGGRADVRVERVDRGRAQAEPAGAGDRDGARRLGGAVVDDADRAGDRDVEAARVMSNVGRVAAAGVVGVAGEGVARGGGADVVLTV